MLATFPLTWAIKNYTRKAAKQGNKRTDQFLMLNQLKTSKRERDRVSASASERALQSFWAKIVIK